ncbi:MULTISPECIES: hypothetical protein [Rhodopseudomonas]|nr:MULTISPECIES: hypothetical protein [Rhodopseudomonas]MDF3813686.1 hypothetical protein [Rhodopseudomonas sp. BAL398]WOK18816.1 hypothetical protein RBJ75_04625 [Rhodopseudomonas sp. BAL398]
MFSSKPQQQKKPPPPKRYEPLPEQDFGGGDICSLEEQPSTDDDMPLD